MGYFAKCFLGYMIFIQTWWLLYDYFVLISGIPEPNVTIQSRIYEVSLKLTHIVQGCYRDVVFAYSITLTFINGSLITIIYTILQLKSTL